MDGSKCSKFVKLYKKIDGLDEDTKQEDRRKALLDEQKRSRAAKNDDQRNIGEFLERVLKRKPSFHRFRRKCIDENPLQLSEWMKERPDDLDQWILVPCPKGIRCLLIAQNGVTELYNKHGYHMQTLSTNLPGDCRAKHQTTVLDCILDKKAKKLFVLDVTVYAGQDIGNCDTEFRFYWITSKLLEYIREDEGQLDLVPLPRIGMANESAVRECFEQFPQFEGNNPALDGFLFYHKEASYTYGTTPLVLWLFAFMVPEMLNFQVHPTYMMSKPSDYVDCRHYMIQFDEDMRKRKAEIKLRFKRKEQRKMDEDLGDDNENGRMDGVDEDDDGSNLADIIDRERELETLGC